MGWGNLVVTEAEKAFTGEVWSQAFLVPLLHGSIWESMNICRVLWAHVTDEASEAAGQPHWDAILNCL